jgi:hypothetical protein
MAFERCSSGPTFPQPDSATLDAVPPIGGEL